MNHQYNLLQDNVISIKTEIKHIYKLNDKNINTSLNNINDKNYYLNESKKENVNIPNNIIIKNDKSEDSHKSIVIPDLNLKTINNLSHNTKTKLSENKNTYKQPHVLTMRNIVFHSIKANNKMKNLRSSFEKIDPNYYKD